jgi:hypothetical protein
VAYLVACVVLGRSTVGRPLVTLGCGLGLHVLATWLRDSGPAWDGVSLRGNEALLVLAVAMAVLAACEVVAFRRRSWLSIVLVPAALWMGLFVIAGGI